MSDFEILTEEKKKQFRATEKNLLEVSSVYLSALDVIGVLEKLTVEQYFDKHGACAHRKRHKTMRCDRFCTFQRAKEALSKFNQTRGYYLKGVEKDELKVGG